MSQLVVKTPQDSPSGSGMIVLNKVIGNSERRVLAAMIGLEEEPSRIAHHAGFDHADFG
jgi:exosome complex RNA-binding protein Csl4